MVGFDFVTPLYMNIIIKQKVAVLHKIVRMHADISELYKLESS